MCFQPLSTALKSYDTLTHIYNLSQLYPRPPAYFQAHTLIYDPPTLFQFDFFCYHMFSRVSNIRRLPTNT